MVSWNILHGGRDEDLGGAKNLPLLLDQLVALAPDVFFSIETYGAARAIRTALTERADKGTYRAVQVTRGPQGQSRDNLWIFTRYRVDRTFPVPRGDTVSDFNTGGARVSLPHGRRLNLFDTWLNFSRPWIGNMVNANEAAAREGKRLPHARSRVAWGERRKQFRQLRDILRAQLPYMLGGSRSPVLLAGDLNTLAAGDWTPRWARCPGHHGLSYDLRTTRLLTRAGFRDTYREKHPDVCEDAGASWNTLRDAEDRDDGTPGPAGDSEHGPFDRIDYVFARGPGISTERSFTVDTRLRSHPRGPFYSDHAALVTDLVLR